MRRSATTLSPSATSTSIPAGASLSEDQVSGRIDLVDEQRQWARERDSAGVAARIQRYAGHRMRAQVETADRLIAGDDGLDVVDGVVFGARGRRLQLSSRGQLGDAEAGDLAANSTFVAVALRFGHARHPVERSESDATLVQRSREFAELRARDLFGGTEERRDRLKVVDVGIERRLHRSDTVASRTLELEAQASGFETPYGEEGREHGEDGEREDRGDENGARLAERCVFTHRRASAETRSLRQVRVLYRSRISRGPRGPYGARADLKPPRGANRREITIVRRRVQRVLGALGSRRREQDLARAGERACDR